MTAEDTTPLPTFAGRLRVADYLYQEEAKDGKNKEGTPMASPGRVLRSRSASVLVESAISSAKGATPSGSSPRTNKRKAEDDEGERAAVQSMSPGRLGALARRQSSQTPSPTKKGGSRSRSNTPSGRSGSSSSSRYAPPATYAHLRGLPDRLAPNLFVLFVGLNPGVETARTGHAYAHPSNLFWKLMRSSGVLPVACTADEDHTLPARFRLGLTNIVARPSRNGAELRNQELDDGVAILEEKARRWRPEVMCMVGKGIWDSVVRVRYGSKGKGGTRQGQPKPAFQYGWQDERENMGRPLDGENADADDVAEGVRVDPAWKGARVFVASSTSGLAATLLPAQKEAIWRELGEWVEQRRKEEAEKEAGQP